jgi:charged multivesicular body protein 6
MGNGSSSNRISAQDRWGYWLLVLSELTNCRAILDMKNQRDRLQQYQKRITRLTDRETAIAKECLAKGQKPKALLALRRKKYQESLLLQTDQQLEQLQKLTSDVEFASVQKDVVFGLKQGTAVLKQIHAEMGGIENVEKLLGENADAIAYQKEVGELLRGQMSNEDEDEVEDELEALEKEVLGVREPEIPNLPSAPRLDPKAADAEQIRQKARARARAGKEAARQAAEPITA